MVAFVLCPNAGCRYIYLSNIAWSLVISLVLLELVIIKLLMPQSLKEYGLPIKSFRYIHFSSLSLTIF